MGVKSGRGEGGGEKRTTNNGEDLEDRSVDDDLLEKFSLRRKTASQARKRAQLFLLDDNDERGKTHMIPFGPSSPPTKSQKYLR
jgi:hypothetical protein